MKRNVLWADDDCDKQLAPLGRILRTREDVSLRAAPTYADAVQALDDSLGAVNAKLNSLLVDIILPYDHLGDGALQVSDLGLKLADRAAAAGVSIVAFLTVVRRDEVADRFVELQRAHPNTRFGFFDKTELLADTELEKLLELLTS